MCSWWSGGAGSKDTVTNTGTIIGNVLLELGDDSLTNSGSISGFVSHHELLHVFDMAGSLAQFGFVTRFVLKTDALPAESYDFTTELNSNELELCLPAATTSAIT